MNVSADDRLLSDRARRQGGGYVDYYPYKRDDDATILELNANHTVDEAFRQIRERQYALRFKG